MAADCILAGLGFFCGLYTVLVTDRFATSNLTMTRLDLFMSILAVCLVILATKKAVGNAMAVLPVLFAMYALFGKYIPGVLVQGKEASKNGSIFYMLSLLDCLTEKPGRAVGGG